jgi:hypothetical protein
MNRARLRYADGREEIREVDPTVTVVMAVDADGATHQFVETNEIDADGCDVYVEQPPEQALLTD